jgi:hypothetical protein
MTGGGPVDEHPFTSCEVHATAKLGSIMFAPSPVSTHIKRQLGAVAFAACALCAGNAQAELVSLVDYTTLSQIGSLQFYQQASDTVATASSGSAYLGSYQLSTGQWAFCLSPFTDAQVGVSTYNKVPLGDFLAPGGAYEQQFGLTHPNYAGFAPGYDNQPGAGNTALAGSVINRIVSMFNWAYADTQVATGNISAAEKSAALAYALWEIEGESGAYDTAAGGLRQSGLNADVLSYASTLFANLASGSWAGFAFQAYRFEVYQAAPITSSQSFLVVTPTSDNRNTVPEPASLPLVAGSLLALALTHRAARRR